MTALMFSPDRPATRPEALRCRIVRRHLALQAMGQVADAAVALTLARLLLVEVAGTSTREIAVGIAASVVPAVLSLPFAWMVADSLRRNSSLALAHTARAVITLAAALVPITASHAIGFAVIAATTAAQTFTGSLRSASLGHAVASTRLVAANSLAAVTGKAAGGLGIAIVVATNGISPLLLFALAALMHLFAAGGYATWSTDLGGRRMDDAAVPQVGRALVHLLRHPIATALVPTAILVRAVQGASIISLISMLEQQYSQLSVPAAAVLASTSTGVFVGMTLAPNYWRWHDDNRVRRGAFVVVCAAVCAAVLTDRTVMSIAAVCVISIAFGALKVRADASVQEHCIGQSRGRVCSAYDASYHVAFVTGAVMAAASPLSGHHLGLASTLGIGMALVSACSLATGRRSGAAS